MSLILLGYITLTADVLSLMTHVPLTFEDMYSGLGFIYARRCWLYIHDATLASRNQPLTAQSHCDEPNSGSADRLGQVLNMVNLLKAHHMSNHLGSPFATT